MKKVKIMLTAIISMAIVGGALAFQAAKIGGVIYCTTEAAAGACTIRTPGYTVIKFSPTDQGEISTCTTTNDPAADCSPRFTYMNQ